VDLNQKYIIITGVIMKIAINILLTAVGISGLILSGSDSPYMPYLNVCGLIMLSGAVFIYNKYIKK